MAYDYLGAGALDYYPCRYGASNLVFRGPHRTLDAHYCAAIGGTETYGKFVEDPYPALLEKMAGRSVVNLGCLNAGIDVFINDCTVMDICRNASLTIVQVTGTQNVSNRMYSVHPRRNDRFVSVSSLLTSLFPDVEFTDVHYTGHLLNRLRNASPERFNLVQDELRAAWLSRMKKLLTSIGGKVVLLWMAGHSPDAARREDTFWQDPLFLNRSDLDQLSDLIDDLVETIATPEEIAAGKDRMMFSQMEEPAACQMLGPIVQQAAARALAPHLAD